MSKPAVSAIITTIQPPTPSVRSLVGRLAENDIGRLIVVGDTKGPADYDLDGVEFWSLKRQLDSRFQLASCLPVGHYSRKNVGYLAAIAAGAPCIYETDDDNAPLPEWFPRADMVQVAKVVERCDADDGRWVNVYRYFTDENIWPRGLPLDEIGAVPPVAADDSKSLWAPIQQGLVNGSPDVDAIWRLTQDRPFEFESSGSVCLEPGNWCPFNSQSTWWWPLAYPLMYLPSHCSFRMTDIWRSFIAQRCLWELGLGVVFHCPEVVQERNQHNLMRDFVDEVPGYTRNKRLAAILDETRLSPSPSEIGQNLLTCYEVLVGSEFFPAKELELVRAWLEDLALLPAGHTKTAVAATA